VPHVDSEVVATACKDVLSIRARANILHFIWMGDQTHRFVRITVERKLDEPDNFLGC